MPLPTESFRGRSPALPPSFAFNKEHENPVIPPASLSPSRSLGPTEQTDSPEVARQPNPITPASTRSRPRDASSEYYTAAWGSPYQLSPSSRSARTAFSVQAPSEDILESSGPDFGLEHLLPSRLADLSLPQPGLLVPESRVQEPSEEQEDNDLTPRSRTRRWVQLPPRQASEKSHWWSDDSAYSHSEREGRRRGTSSPSGSSRDPGPKSLRGHKLRESNRTLDQRSFWETLREERSSNNMSSLLASRWAADDAQEEKSETELGASRFSPSAAESETAQMDPAEEWPSFRPAKEPSPPVEQDFAAPGLKSSRWAATPTPPTDTSQHGNEGEERIGEGDVEKSGENVVEGNILKSADTQEGIASGAEEEKPLPPLPDVTLQGADEPSPRQDTKPPAPSPSPSPLEVPRLRKKVSWRGRNCIVSIPNFDFETMGIPMPMSSEELQARLQAFEEAGYDTSGFDMPSEDTTSNDGSHVRPLFPADASQDLPDSDRNAVLLPDLNKWRAYMDQLTEQKLAALGVTTSSEDPAPASSQDMSRQSSGQYPALPFSPPIPTPSAGSMGGRPGMPRGHSHTMSFAAPISPMNGPFGHMSRHSTFGGGSPFGLPQQAQQAPQHSFPGLRSVSPNEQYGPQQPQPFQGLQSFSPHNQFSMPGLNQAISPGPTSGLRNEFEMPRATSSPFAQQGISQSPLDYSRGLMEDQMRRQHAYSRSMQQPPMPTSYMSQQANTQQTPALPELPEEDDEEDLLEEPETEADDKPAYVPPHKRAQFNENIAVPTPRGHRHNISEGFERDLFESAEREDAEERETVADEQHKEDEAPKMNGFIAHQASQPAAAAQPQPDVASHKSAVSATSTHSRNISATGLNVDAPAFSFNPKASFQPASTNFTFGAPPPTTSDKQATSFGHTRQASSGSFRASAPTFRPQGLPKTDFSFSAQGPVAKPTAPASEQSNTQDHSAGEKAPEIFGKVEIPDIVKPAKKSKAIAIVRPEKSPEKPLAGSGTEQEDESGRPVRREERQKRQRQFNGDGDEVPRFAEPTPEPQPADFVLKSQQDEPEVDQVEDQITEVLDDVVGKAAETVEAAIGEKKAHVPQSSDVGSPVLSQMSSPPRPLFSRPIEGHTRNLTERLEVHIPKGSFTSVESLDDLEEGEIREDEASLGASPPRPGSGSVEWELANRAPAVEFAKVSSPPQQAGGAQQSALDHPEPSFDEIDAVMQQISKSDAQPAPPTLSKPEPELRMPSPARTMAGVTYLSQWKEKSPSPKRLAPPALATPKRQRDSFSAVHDRAASGEPFVNGWTPKTRLNKYREAPSSDWSDVLSPTEEAKLHQRSKFFGNHVEDVIGRVVEHRLQPLEDGLKAIQQAVSRPQVLQGSPKKEFSRQRSKARDSDADDEDETADEQKHRPISRGRDKRVDQVKAVVLEALREQSPRRSQGQQQPGYDLAELHSVLADMKISFARAASASLELEDIRAVVEDVLSKQSQALVPTGPSEEASKELAYKQEMSELEGRLNGTLASALEEANHRRQVEEREAETRRMLRLAEEELQILRESHRDDNLRMNAAEQEREDLRFRLEQSERAQRDAEERANGLEDENSATYATLEEYRMSSHKWRQDIDQATSEREELENTVAELERQVEEGQESSSGMRRRLEKLHSDMATAAGQLATEKASMKAKEEEYRVRCETAEAQQAADFMQRSQLEDELRSLRSSAIEGTEAKVFLEQMRASNASLDEMVRKLSTELAEQQSIAARYERDFNDAREAGRVEVYRTRMAMEIDVEAANHQVNLVRADLESELSRVRTELENARMEAETATARHDRLLEEEDSGRREALRKVNHSNSVALDEARTKHEAIQQEQRAAHARAMNYALEDKQRSESFLNERLALSEAKVQHFGDRVLHLEERLEVAKSAAQAAAMNAQSKAAAAPAPAPKPTSSTATIPEKISPQALRESILVLQEQLQERESTIEQLRTDAASPDNPAAQIKSLTDETNWLRELLAVRSEELTDLVNTLASPTFDRNAVRDTAIRIRANLEMERQEKERAAHPEQQAESDPSQQLPAQQAMASISSFATPKAAQLASAFSKWRANMESSALKNAPRSAGASRAGSRAGSSAGFPRSSTPSKASKQPAPSSAVPPGYAEGLMTPPASNLRQTPSPEAMAKVPAPRLGGQRGSDGSAQLRPQPYVPQAEREDEAVVSPHDEEPKMSYAQEHAESEPEAAAEGPATPLFGAQSYDMDANEDGGKFDMKALEAEDDEGAKVGAQPQSPVLGNDYVLPIASKGSLADELGDEDEEGDEDLDIADNQPPAFRSLEEELGEEM